MPSYSLLKELHCNTSAEVSSPLLSGKTSASARPTAIVWAVRDRFPLRVYLLSPADTVGAAPEILSLAGGKTLHLACRPSSLFATAEDTLVATADLTATTDSDGDACFDGILSLRGSNLTGLFTTGVKSTTLVCDVECLDATASEGATICQFTATVVLDARRGDDAEVGDEVAIYPAAADIVTLTSPELARIFGTVEALQAIGTDNATLPRLAILTTDALGVGIWKLSTGTAAHNPSGGIIRPTDYAITTNEQVWARAL